MMFGGPLRSCDFYPGGVKLLFGVLQQIGLYLRYIAGVGARCGQRQDDSLAAHAGDEATTDICDFRNLLRNVNKNLARPGNVSTLGHRESHTARRGGMAEGQVDARLAGNRGVRNDKPASVRRAQCRVAQIDALNHSNFRSGWGGNLHTVTNFEGPVENQGDSRHQIAQSALRSQSDDDGNDAYACQPGRAQFLQRRNQVGVTD